MDVHCVPHPEPRLPLLSPTHPSGCHPSAPALSALFKLYAKYIMIKAGLDDSQARIKIARRNVNNLRCADDTTLMAEREEELKSFLMRVKEEVKKKLA